MCIVMSMLNIHHTMNGARFEKLQDIFVSGKDFAGEKLYVRNHKNGSYKEYNCIDKVLDDNGSIIGFDLERDGGNEDFDFKELVRLRKKIDMGFIESMEFYTSLQQQWKFSPKQFDRKPIDECLLTHPWGLFSSGRTQYIPTFITPTGMKCIIYVGYLASSDKGQGFVVQTLRGCKSGYHSTTDSQSHMGMCKHIKYKKEEYEMQLSYIKDYHTGTEALKIKHAKNPVVTEKDEYYLSSKGKNIIGAAIVATSLAVLYGAVKLYSWLRK